MSETRMARTLRQKATARTASCIAVSLPMLVCRLDY